MQFLLEASHISGIEHISVVSFTLPKFNLLPKEVLLVPKIVSEPSLSIVLNQIQRCAIKYIYTVHATSRVILFRHYDETVRDVDKGKKLLVVKIKCGALVGLGYLKKALHGILLRQTS